MKTVFKTIEEQDEFIALHPGKKITFSGVGCPLINMKKMFPIKGDLRGKGNLIKQRRKFVDYNVSMADKSIDSLWKAIHDNTPNDLMKNNYLKYGINRGKIKNYLLIKPRYLRFWFITKFIVLFGFRLVLYSRNGKVLWDFDMRDHKNPNYGFKDDDN